MINIQISTPQPTVLVKRSLKSDCNASKPCLSWVPPCRQPNPLLSLVANSSLRQQCLPILKQETNRTRSKDQKLLPVCLFGTKGNAGSDNKDPPWKAFEDVVGNLTKGRSIEDVLRQQIEKKEYNDGGGSGRKPPRRGDGGGDSGSSDGDDSGGFEEESVAAALDEVLQVFLATTAVLLLYIYIVSGDELFRLAKDCLFYLFGGEKSPRLDRLMYQIGLYYQRLGWKKKTDHYWLEKEILTTPTWWHDPEKYQEVARAYRASKSRKSRSYEEDDDRGDAELDNRDDWDYDDRSGRDYDDQDEP